MNVNVHVCCCVNKQTSANTLALTLCSDNTTCQCCYSLFPGPQVSKNISLLLWNTEIGLNQFSPWFYVPANQQVVHVPDARRHYLAKFRVMWTASCKLSYFLFLYPISNFSCNDHNTPIYPYTVIKQFSFILSSLIRPWLLRYGPVCMYWGLAGQCLWVSQEQPNLPGQQGGE